MIHLYDYYAVEKVVNQPKTNKNIDTQGMECLKSKLNSTRHYIHYSMFS